jgi:hypothetical protein
MPSRSTSFNTNDVGVGGRLTYNVTEGTSIEGEINFFPQDKTFGGKRTQGLFGFKYGIHSDTFGLFGKLRPGFIRFSRASAEGGCPLVTPGASSLSGCFAYTSKTNLALDIGGVFEVYPSGRSVVRFDVGDTFIRFGGIEWTFDGARSGSFTTHNLQFNAGVGVRF